MNIHFTQRFTRTRWAAIGASLSIVFGAAGAAMVHAAGNGAASALVPITPCRLVDTRKTEPVGVRTTPLAAGETATFQATGANGNCTIPANATGLSTNVTVLNPTAASFLTVFPADAAKPLSANLNWTPQSSPTPNQVTVGLSPTGAIKAYNLAGNIDVVIDVVGYYVAASGGPGARGPAAWDTIPSGTTVTGEIYYETWNGNAADTWSATAQLPGLAPVALTDATVNVGKYNLAPNEIVDPDPLCTGSDVHPTAPAGKVCVYVSNALGFTSVGGYVAPGAPTHNFAVNIKPGFVGHVTFIANWAYTAP
jgi:hypothetical protein